MHTEYIEYQDKDAALEGYLAYEPANGETLPTIIIAHAWRGRDEFVCQKAEALAQLGYVGFALDLYGKDVLGHSVEENTRLMKPFIEDRALLRQRLTVAFETVQTLDIVDSHRIGIIGYCFGGLCALDLARSGADIKGVVSFHGLLHAPENLPSKPIQAKILALHGHNDPMVPPEQVAAFAKENVSNGFCG